MARIADLRVFPVKGLDGVAVESTAVLEGGTLEHDREYALFDEDGNVVNGKRTDSVHDLRTDFRAGTNTLAVETPEGDQVEFDLAADRERAGRWFGDFFDADLTLHRDTSLGYVDRREMGPSVVSTATLRTVASWFEGIDVEGARRRLRANVEIADVPPFWEDRLVGQDAPTIEAGGVRLEGVTPCGRCVVPERDPDTGEPTPEFRQRFVRKREETFPDWADEAAFEHFYTLMVIARVPEADRGQSLRVGDEVTVID